MSGDIRLRQAKKAAPYKERYYFKYPSLKQGLIDCKNDLGFPFVNKDPLNKSLKRLIIPHMDLL